MRVFIVLVVGHYLRMGHYLKLGRALKKRWEKYWSDFFLSLEGCLASCLIFGQFQPSCLYFWLFIKNMYKVVPEEIVESDLK